MEEREVGQGGGGEERGRGKSDTGQGPGLLGVSDEVWVACVDVGQLKFDESFHLAE